MGRKVKNIGDNPVARNLNRILRSGQGMKQNLILVEKETGIAKSTIRNWLSGHRKAQLGNLEKIAKVLGFDVYTLFDDPELSPEQKEAIELIEHITDKNVLEAIKSVAKVGILQKSRQGDKKENASPDHNKP